MNIFELKIWDDEGRLCTFYTVQAEDAEENETDKFFEKYDAIPKYKSAAAELLQYVLTAIGDDHGAKKELFNRKENEVDGLPCQRLVRLRTKRYHYPGFPLRLYALKISEQIVVLFNGGVKDSDTNQTSSLHLNWMEACLYAKRIKEALRTGTIYIAENNRVLLTSDGKDEIIL